jgi:flagellar biosynthetic protein FlhB
MGDGEEKTETATAKHRLDARKQGTVAKSTDLVQAFGILSLILVMPGAINSISTGLINSLKACLGHLPTDASYGHLTGFSSDAMRPILPGLSMIVFCCMGVGLVMNFAQVGFMINATALMPKFSKLNPLSGIKRLVSRNSAFDTAKGLGKASLFSLITYGCIHSSWADLNSLNRVPVMDGVSLVGGIMKSLAMRVGFTWGVLAALDYFFQRNQIDRQLRMTKQEVKREMREMETAPEVKGARMMRARKLMRKRLRDAVRSADVVVTNPTHFAVALKYEMGKSYAPIVVAKGVDYLASKIREEAALAEIPLVPNPPLARALYKQCEIGDYVPRELFQAVAEVLAYVYRTLKRIPK